MSTWQHRVRTVDTWGTTIVLEARAEHLDTRVVDEAFKASEVFLREVNDTLSTYIPGSPVDEYRHGRLSEIDAPPMLREVLKACREIRLATDGAFNPWVAPGGFDPSGFVKGWAADKAADILLQHGLENVGVNAAGDVTCRGESKPGLGGWIIGITDPRDPHQLITTALVVDAHLATSGHAEQEGHIIDPDTGAPLNPATAPTVSVLHPNGGWADAYATALSVRGAAGIPLLDDQASCFMVQGGQVWHAGAGIKRPE